MPRPSDLSLDKSYGSAPTPPRIEDMSQNYWILYWQYCTIGYGDIKELIVSKCGLREVILDNLQREGSGMKVTVGVMEEEDAALLVRKVNGIYFMGQQLYVEDKRLKKESEQPYHTSMSAVQPPQYPMQQAQPLLSAQPQSQQASVYDAQVQAMGNMGIYQQMANYMYPQNAGHQTLQNPHELMAYGHQQLMSQYPGAGEFVQPYAAAQETGSIVGRHAAVDGSRDVGMWGDSLLVGSNNRHRPALSPPPGWSPASEQPEPKRTKWDQPPRNECSDQGVRSEGGYDNMRRMETHGGHPNSQRGGHFSDKRGGNPSIQRGGYSNQRSGHLSDQGGGHPYNQRDGHSFDQRGGHPSHQREGYSSNQRGGQVSSRDERGGYSDNHARSDRKRRWDETNDRRPADSRDRRPADSRDRRPADSRDRPYFREPMETQTLDPPAASLGRSKKYQKSVNSNAMYKMLAEFAENLNVQPEFEGTTPFKSVLRKLFTYRIVDIVGKEFMTVDEICDRYRQKYPRSGDSHLYVAIKQKLAEGQMSSEELWEFLWSFVEGSRQSSRRHEEPRPVNQATQQPGVVTKRKIHGYIRSIMPYTIGALGMLTELHGPPSLFKSALKKLIFMRIEDIMDNQILDPDVICDRYRDKYPKSGDAEMFERVKQLVEDGEPMGESELRENLSSFVWATSTRPSRPRERDATPHGVHRGLTLLQQLRRVRTHAMTKLLYETVENLRIQSEMGGPSPLKSALRKAIIMRVTDILDGKPMSPEESCEKYRQRYPLNRDVDMYTSIKQRLASENMTPEQLEEYLKRFVESSPKRKSRSGTRDVPESGPESHRAEPEPEKSVKPSGADFKACNVEATMSIIRETVKNLRIYQEMSGTSLLKSALRKVITLRVADIMLGKIMPYDAIHKQYREKYPRDTDNNLYTKIKRKVAEKPYYKQTTTTIDPDLKNYLVTFVDNPKRLEKLEKKIPEFEPWKIPSYPEGNKKIHSLQKQEHKKELQTLSGYEVNPTCKQAMDEEVEYMRTLMKKEFGNPQNADEEAAFQAVDQEGCINHFTKFVFFHLSKRITDGGVKLCRIYGSPRLPKQRQLENLLLPYKCLSLKKNKTQRFWTATFSSYDSIDTLCNMSPIDIGNGSTATFKYMHIAPPTPKLNLKYAKQQRKMYVKQLIDFSSVNLLDKDWQKQAAEIEKSKDDDVILVENEVKHIDITKEEGMDDRNNTAEATENNTSFLHEDFKVIDEVRESDNDDNKADDNDNEAIDDDNVANDGVKAEGDQIDEDWDQNGDDWGDEGEKVESKANRENGDEQRETIDDDVIMDKDVGRDEGIDDEDIGEDGEDINIADIDWDNVDEDDLEDY